MRKTVAHTFLPEIHSTAGILWHYEEKNETREEVHNNAFILLFQLLVFCGDGIQNMYCIKYNVWTSLFLIVIHRKHD